MLVEVHDERSGAGVTDRDARLLLRLAHGRVLGTLTRLDVAPGLEPTSEAAVEVEEHGPVALVDDDCRCRDVRRERGSQERIIRCAEERIQVRDRLTLLTVERAMLREAAGELDDARVGRPAQVRTSLSRTAPVLSSS
jgi:hypothetical protein